MREGLLWYDADERRPITAKIDAAARRGLERFGRAPNCCHVHPDDVVDHPTLRVVPNSKIARHHFWVGIDDSLIPAGRVRRRHAGAA